MKNLFQKIQRKLSGISPIQANMDYLLSQGLTIGSHFRNNSDYPFDAAFPWLISVGDNVCLSANVKILAHDTSTEYVTGYTKLGRVDIGNNVYIGYGTTILCNVRIGDNSIIGAGSVVSKDVLPNSVFVGNPAHYICSIDEYRSKHQALMEKVPVYDGPCQKWWAASKQDKNSMLQALEKTHGYMR